jgi:hypothetical protein
LPCIGISRFSGAMAACSPFAHVIPHDLPTVSQRFEVVFRIVVPEPGRGTTKPARH